MKRLFILYILILAVSCSDNTIDSDHDVLLGTEDYVAFSTKSVEAGTTFLCYLASPQGIVASGTYVASADGNLIPCEVQEGTPVQTSNGDFYNSSKGLRASNGDYKLVIVSPAVPMTSNEEVQNGYFYNRNKQDGDNDVYVSAPIPVTLGGVYLSDSQGQQYVFDASPYVLKQPRSSIQIKLKCGKDIKSTTIRSIKLHNYIEKGYYLPVESRFHFSRQNDVKDDYPLYSTVTTLNTNQTMTLKVNEHILSMNYKELDIDGTYKWPMPSLEVVVGPTEDNAFPYTALLGFDFQPQHSYEFTITVNSAFVNIQVTVIPWEPVGMSAGIEGANVWEINIPVSDATSGLDWEQGGNSTGTI